MSKLYSYFIVILFLVNDFRLILIFFVSESSYVIREPETGMSKVSLILLNICYFEFYIFAIIQKNFFYLFSMWHLK